MRLFSAILARNEAGSDRCFRAVLTRCREFSDAVLVLDDRSTDATPKIAREAGAVVRTRSVIKERAWGHEAPARAELWDFASEYATARDDWVLVCDADMLFQGDPRELCQSSEVNAWAVILYDLWSETEYRSDQFWQGHHYPRPWVFAPRRVPDGWMPVWPARGLHCGHAPLNFPLECGIAPLDRYYYLHLAYSTADLRVKKHANYLQKAHLLTEFEKAHAASIMDDP